MAKAMLVVLAVAVVMLMKGTAAEIFTVGDANGWRLPPSVDFYPSWASEPTFVVGDTLVFNFETGFHTVAMVTSIDAYEKCDHTLDKNAQIFKEGPVKIPLNPSGRAFFFCTISTHCKNGQKFLIDVVSDGSKTSPDVPTPSEPASDGSKTSPDVPTPSEPAKDNAASMPLALSLSSFSVSLVAFVFMALLF